MLRLIKEKRRHRTMLDNCAKWFKGFKILLEGSINKAKGHYTEKERPAATERRTLKERWSDLQESIGELASRQSIEKISAALKQSAGKIKERQLVQDYLNVWQENADVAKKHHATLKYNAKQLREWYGKQTLVSRVGIGAVAYFVVFFSVNAIFVGNACGVYVNGNQVAVVADESFAKNTLTEVIKDKSNRAGVPLEINDVVYYRGVHAKKDTFLDKEELKDTLNNALSFNTNAVTLVVNGESRLSLNDMQEAQDMLAWLKSLYPAESDETVSFKEQVELVETVVNEKDITPVDEAKDMILYGSDKVEQYVVKNGDTAWDIAAKYDVFLDTLQINNPGVDLWNIKVDQTLKLSREVPMVTVMATRQYTTDEEIPYTVEERSDDKLMPGERRVIASGVAGLRTVTYDVTKENGFEVERVELEQEVLREPTTEVVARGSQIMLASRGGGRIGWPCGGSVISSFGMRSGRMHNGVDISGSYGTSVVAAAAGTVIHAASGYEGGYGNNVEISHGSGYVTKYAHLSSINVHVGQTVQRGELIGRVGATGNAVGAHLHFEVRVNGAPQNPTNYF